MCSQLEANQKPVIRGVASAGKGGAAEGGFNSPSTPPSFSQPLSPPPAVCGPSGPSESGLQDIQGDRLCALPQKVTLFSSGGPELQCLVNQVEGVVA